MGSIRRAGAALAGLLLVALSGCNYESPNRVEAPKGTFRPGVTPTTKRATTAAAAKRDEEERAAILDSSINLIQTAALKSGGDNFRLATQKLNQYFEGVAASEYHLSPEVQTFLARWLPPEMMEDLQSPHWSGLRDARHLEDCMMYYGVANRVGGVGDDLTRARRVFEWIVEQIQLVPPGSLGSNQVAQVYARPFDLLLRGMGTESQGYWAERSWMFMAFCRQLGIDAALLTYSKGNTVEPRIPGTAGAMPGAIGGAATNHPPVVWVCAALIGDEAYLFDARVGLPIPGPGGEGVATLRQAMSDPAILERMNLPGLSAYETSMASLLASPTKIGVLLDSSQGYFTPKMKLLQAELSGKNRTILYRDPVEERSRFAKALGDQLGEVDLWTLPLEVETRLFNDPQFVTATQQSLFFFRGEMPLLHARVKHLRGDLAEAISDYVSFRFSDSTTLVTDKDELIPRQIQEGLDVYATYYLALAHLERENLAQAELMFRKTLEMLPQPGPGQPFYYMFRWGAHSNLGRIYEAMGDPRRAIAHYTQANPTMQRHGDLLRARELVWKDPAAAVPDPLPPAPKEFTRLAAPAPTPANVEIQK